MSTSVSMKPAVSPGSKVTPVGSMTVKKPLEQVGQEHGQHDGPGSGAGIIHQRFDADGTHLADIAHGDDAGENGEKTMGTTTNFSRFRKMVPKGLI